MLLSLSLWYRNRCYYSAATIYYIPHPEDTSDRGGGGAASLLCRAKSLQAKPASTASLPKEERLYSTCASPVVPHLSTRHAHGCLASEIGRDPAFPTRYDRTEDSSRVSSPDRLAVATRPRSRRRREAQSQIMIYDDRCRPILARGGEGVIIYLGSPTTSVVFVATKHDRDRHPRRRHTPQ